MNRPCRHAPSLYLRLPTDARYARMARRTARSFAARVGLRGQRLDELELAVAEAVANVVMHAACEPSATFEVAGDVVDDWLTVRTTDAGPGLDAPTPARGLGLGVPLMIALCDDVTFDVSRAGGVRVSLTFQVTDRDTARPDV